MNGQLRGSDVPWVAQFTSSPSDALATLGTRSTCHREPAPVLRSTAAGPGARRRSAAPYADIYMCPDCWDRTDTLFMLYV